MSLNNFGAGGNIFTKLLQTTCPKAGVITRIQLLEDPPPKFGRAKRTSKFRPDFWQLSTLIGNISGMDRHIEHLRKTWSATTLSTLGDKTLVNFGPQTKKFCWLILTNQRRYFSGDYISAIRRCCTLKFLNALQIDQAYLAHTQDGTGVPPKNFNRENLKLGLKFNVWASITSELVGVSSRNFSRRRDAR